MLLPIGPDVFDGVQFRRIAGEVLHPLTFALSADEIAPYYCGRSGVSDDQQGSGNAGGVRPEEVTETGS